MQSNAQTVDEYLAELPPERRATIQAVRTMILEHLPEGYKEGMQYGMIGYTVPHAIYPAGYHVNPKEPLPFAGLASQKHHCSLYLMPADGDPAIEEAVRDAFGRAGKKLDMGKSCIRFKRADDLPLAALGAIIASLPVDRYLAQVEHTLDNRKPRSHEYRVKMKGSS